ncbi:hypothetical protein DSL64_26930 [Dyadobacter luteus]|jgi:putative oxidoreductase|uniref:Methylamine utilisation protein MauE domain-containing protein n=1 Tax=Dyadobacter luteus TaxID=2259619 RepID=A0A3D8Y352_9BACT|nr:MauE/DoxX family redox-associated membrane protein [Dyadobacter luteus]REA56432.1 hypothetical protein DSL64_26930 [Dyadobacter luteus]
MHTRNLVKAITFLLTVLFLYTALSKLMDLDTFHSQLANQNIPKWTVAYLVWLIPASELLAVGLMIFGSSRSLGLYMSSLLMLAFTVYIGLVVIGFFDRVPCSCGGVLKSMSFGSHLVFNLFFLSIAILAANLNDALSLPVDRS